MIRIFIGYDPREAVAYHVLTHSILERASQPVSIAPLALRGLKHTWGRDRDPLQSTDFAFTRFLVPMLCEFRGWALFLDCDMLVLDDIAQLWAMRDEHYAVQVVKHMHEPREADKFLGAPQTRYVRKNWSSVMLFNCDGCRTLNASYVRTASGLDLHQFRWCTDYAIGELPSRWNHLVDYDSWRNDAALVHYTTGGPWFDAYRNCDYAPEWRAARERMLHAENPQQQMGARNYASA